MRARFDGDRTRATLRRSPTIRTQHGLIVIDYLQLLHGTGRERSKEQEVSAICRGSGELAKELQVPVVVLSQLNP